MTLPHSTSRTRHPALYRQLDRLRSPEEVASRIDQALDELDKWQTPDAGATQPTADETTDDGKES